MLPLASRRVVFVTGKGGVGKTTVAASIAMASARSGKRVLLCETQGATRVPALFGKPSKGYEATGLANNLYTLSITPEEAIREYVMLQLHFQRLYRMVFENRVMGPFVDAVPGLHDLVQLGKVWFAERETENGRPRWDQIVVDAPATGHGLTMFGAPRAMMDLTRAGPFYDNAQRIAELVEDPSRTVLVLVTIPEEMPLRETEQLYARLGPMQQQVAGLVLNEVRPSPVSNPAAWPADQEALLVRDEPGRRAAVEIINAELDAVERQQGARVRLARLGLPVVEFPFHYRRDLGRNEIEGFANTFAGAL